MNPKNVIITGCDHGLGLGLAHEYLRRGYQVIATTLKAEPCSALLDGVGALPGSLTTVQMDVSSDASVQQAVAQILEWTDKVELLINNAAILGETEHTIEEPSLDFDEMLKVININSIGPLRMIHGVWPLLMTGTQKYIVNISSEASSVSTTTRDAWFGYCMSKTALNMGAALVHNKLRKHGGRVLQIHPGWMRTYMHGFFNNQATYEVSEAAANIASVVESHLHEPTTDQPAFLDLLGNPMPW